MSKDKNKKEVEGTPVTKRKTLEEKELDLLSKCTEAITVNVNTKYPNQMNLQHQKCLHFLFTSRKSCHSWINVTEK